MSLVDVLSVSLSRDVPALVRPIAAPIVDRIARESMRADARRGGPFRTRTAHLRFAM